MRWAGPASACAVRLRCSAWSARLRRLEADAAERAVAVILQQDVLQSSSPPRPADATTRRATPEHAGAVNPCTEFIACGKSVRITVEQDVRKKRRTASSGTALRLMACWRSIAVGIMFRSSAT